MPQDAGRRNDKGLKIHHKDTKVTKNDKNYLLYSASCVLRPASRRFPFLYSIGVSLCP